MKVNPTTSAGDDKALLAKSGAPSLQSLGRGKTSKKDKKIHCRKILVHIFDGKYWIIMMTLITLFALFGVQAFYLTRIIGRFEGLAHR